MNHIKVDHFISLLLSGHGDFAHKLHSFNLRTDPFCQCGNHETAEHVILTCPQYEVTRERWMLETNTLAADMDSLQKALSTPAGFKSTVTFWTDVMRKKGWQA